MKWLIALLLTCSSVLGQGFGSFSYDQPFLSASGTHLPSLPHTNYIRYWWASSDLPDGRVENWVDRITSLSYSNATAATRPTNVNGGVYFPNTSTSDDKFLTNTTIFLTASNTPAVLIVTSNMFPVYSAVNNYGNFWIDHTLGTGFRIQTNADTTVRWGLEVSGGNVVNPQKILAVYTAGFPQGVQAVFYVQTNNYWACYTNRVFSTSTSESVAWNYPLRLIGRSPDWNNSTSFRGHVLELIVWTNSQTFTAQDILDVFDSTTNTYGHFGP